MQACFVIAAKHEMHLRHLTLMSQLLLSFKDGFKPLGAKCSKATAVGLAQMGSITKKVMCVIYLHILISEKMHHQQM